MKLSWLSVLLFATACSAAKTYKSDGEIRPLTPEPGAFYVAVPDTEPVTRRYRFKAEELPAEGTDYTLRMNGADEGFAGPLGPPIADATTSALCQAVRMIRDFVAPDSWDDDPRRAVYVEKDEIVVRHAPEVLNQVERLFESVKANRDVMMSLNARLVSMRREELEIIEHLPTIRGGLGGVVETRSLEAFGLTRRARVICTPRLTLFHGQMGSIRIASNYAFIAGYEKKGEEVFDPKPSVAWAGIELTARGVVNGPGSNRWVADLTVTSRDLPILPSLPAVRLGNRLYELPAAVETRASGQFVVGPDQSILILAPEVKAAGGITGTLSGERPEKDRVTLVVVTVDRAK